MPQRRRCSAAGVGCPSLCCAYPFRDELLHADPMRRPPAGWLRCLLASVPVGFGACAASVPVGFGVCVASVPGFSVPYGDELHAC